MSISVPFIEALHCGIPVKSILIDDIKYSLIQN